MGLLDDMAEWAQSADFKTIVAAKLSGDTEALHEASLSRVLKHIDDAKTTSYAILTSQRSARTPKENASMFKDLQARVRARGLGFIKLQGHWKECQTPGVDYAKCKPEDLVDAAEPSLFVPGIDLATAKTLMKRFEQDAILYAGPETDGDAMLVYGDGTKQKIGKFTPGSVGQAFSKLKGKSFYFEWIAQGHVEALIESEARAAAGKAAVTDGG